MEPRMIGIDALGLAVPDAFLPLAALAARRGVPEAKLTAGLGLHAMAVPSPEDDTVTLAARAAKSALARGGVSPSEIGLCVVGTETAVDHSKPVASFVQGLVGLPASCRIFEAKHACFGGTAGLMVALDWIRAGSARGRKALVVCSDIARYGIGTPGEPTQGAGAVALVVSEAPRLVAIDAETVGTYSRDVMDFWRPLDRSDALVDGHYSVECYLAALEGAFDAHRALVGEEAARPGYTDRFAAMLYHVPYPKMAQKAHARLRARDGDDAPEVSFEAKVRESLALPRVVGNVYTGSLYLALASLLATSGGRDLAGERALFFSYGSGCCAELFTGEIRPGAQAALAGLPAELAARRELTVDEYEALFQARDAARAPARAPSGAWPRFLGVEDGKRVYG
jgi:hydroxymethylglutaryl-CoA synthase